MITRARNKNHAYEPTPQRILRETRRIQNTWDATTRQQRSGRLESSPRVETQIVSLADVRRNVLEGKDD